jgi:hypothetical protein
MTTAASETIVASMPSHSTYVGPAADALLTIAMVDANKTKPPNRYLCWYFIRTPVPTMSQKTLTVF